MFAPPPHTSAASVITAPHKSVRNPANSTGGAYSRLILMAPNADPQNSTNSANSRTVKRRPASNDRPPRTLSRSTYKPAQLTTYAPRDPTRSHVTATEDCEKKILKRRLKRWKY